MVLVIQKHQITLWFSRHTSENSETGWHRKEGVIFIATADELRKWKESMEEPEREWRDAQQAIPTPPPNNNPWEIFKITFYICLDRWFIKDILNNSQLKPHCCIFFLNKEDWKCEYSVSSIFPNGCVSYKTLPAANTVCQYAQIKWVYNKQNCNISQWSMIRCSHMQFASLPHIIRKSFFFGHILSTLNSVNIFFRRSECFPPDSLWMTARLFPFKLKHSTSCSSEPIYIFFITPIFNKKLFLLKLYFTLSQPFCDAWEKRNRVHFKHSCLWWMKPQTFCDVNPLTESEYELQSILRLERRHTTENGLISIQYIIGRKRSRKSWS